MTLNKIVPCLWFDNQAEDAAQFYTAIFKNSKILLKSHYGEVGQEIHGRKPGSVMTVEFELEGHAFTALNGGPLFKFNEAISFQVMCETQQEIDYYWEKLRVGGDPKAEQCGWLKDKFGVSWQVAPRMMTEMLKGGVTEKTERVMAAMFEMKKLDIDKLQKAYDGK